MPFWNRYGKAARCSFSDVNRQTYSEFRVKTCVLPPHCLSKYSPIWSIHLRKYLHHCLCMSAQPYNSNVESSWIVLVILIVGHCWCFRTFVGVFYILYAYISLFQPVYTLANDRIRSKFAIQYKKPSCADVIKSLIFTWQNKFILT